MFRKLCSLLLGLLVAAGVTVGLAAPAQAAQPTWLCGRSSPQSVSPVIFRWQFDTTYDQSVPLGQVWGEGGCGIIGATSTNAYPFGFLLGGGGCARHRWGRAPFPNGAPKTTNTYTQSQITWSASVHTVGPFASTTFQDFRAHPDYDQFFDSTDHGAIIFDVRKYTPTNGVC